MSAEVLTGARADEKGELPSGGGGRPSAPPADRGAFYATHPPEAEGERREGASAKPQRPAMAAERGRPRSAR